MLLPYTEYPSCRPTNVFGPGKMYHPLLYSFLIGAIAPVIPYFLAKRFPNSWAKYINTPVLFSAMQSVPPATAVNIVPAAIVFHLQLCHLKKTF